MCAKRPRLRHVCVCVLRVRTDFSVEGARPKARIEYKSGTIIAIVIQCKSKHTSSMKVSSRKKTEVSFPSNHTLS